MSLYLIEPVPRDISYLIPQSLAKSCDVRAEVLARRLQALFTPDPEDLFLRAGAESALFLYAVLVAAIRKE